MGAEGCDTATDEKTPVANEQQEQDAPSEEAAEEEEAAEPNPDGTSELACSYELGDFGESGDPAKGFRFTAGGTIENTGNIGTRVRVTYKWKLLGREALKVRKIYKVRPGQERDVNITQTASDDDIDAHQNAKGDCSTSATIVGTFGTVQ